MERTDTVCLCVTSLRNFSRLKYRGADLPYSHFTWAWHAVIMGTGITSALLTNFPYGGDTAPLQWLGFVLFVLNLILFIFVCGCTVMRYIIFPEVRVHRT